MISAYLSFNSSLCFKIVVAFAVGIMSDYHLRFVDFVLVYLFCFYASVRNIFDFFEVLLIHMLIIS